MRKTYIDKLRIIAILLVIFNHTGGIEAFAYLPTFGSLKYLFYLFVSLSCKIAVPLFFMISGATMLNRNKPPQFYIKKILKMCFFICTITVLYVLYKYIRYGEICTVKNIIIYIYSGKGLSSHLWYLYAYLAFLLSLPILDLVVKNISSQNITWILCFYIIYKMILICQFILVNNTIQLSGYLQNNWFLLDIFVYPILGYYIDNNYVNKKKSNILYILGIVALLIEMILITTLVHRNENSFDGVNVQNFHNFLIMIPAMAIFVFGKLNLNTIRGRDVIEHLGKATFGVYVIHIMIKDLKQMKWLFEYFTNTLGIDYMFSDIVFVLIVWILSVALVNVFLFIKQLLLKSVQLKNYKNV